MFRKIKCYLGWCNGRVITKLDDDRNVWVAFQCDDCGKIIGAHKTNY